jgi:thiamine pyrophosphate-dependent acetolactate synthase large subunit-like protein
MSNSTRQHMTIGDFLLRRLKEAGVRHLFGVPGRLQPRAVAAAPGHWRAAMGRHLQ